MNWEQLIPLISAIILSIPGIVALIRGLRKERAETAQIITEAADKIVKQYTARLDEMDKKLKEQATELACQDKKIKLQEQEIARQNEKIKLQARQIARQSIAIRKLRGERAEFLSGVQSLCNQIKALGHKPVWEPVSTDTEDDDDYRVDGPEERNEDGVSLG